MKKYKSHVMHRVVAGDRKTCVSRHEDKSDGYPCFVLCETPVPSEMVNARGEKARRLQAEVCEFERSSIRELLLSHHSLHVMLHQLPCTKPQIVFPVPILILGTTNLGSKHGGTRFDSLVALQALFDESPSSVDDLSTCLCLDSASARPGVGGYLDIGRLNPNEFAVPHMSKQSSSDALLQTTTWTAESFLVPSARSILGSVKPTAAQLKSALGKDRVIAAREPLSYFGQLEPK